MIPHSSGEATVTVVVVTWNRLELTRRCLESLMATKAPWWRLVVVDNGSEDGSPEYLRALRRRGGLDGFVALRGNMGVAAAQNLGWAMFPGTHYVKVDNDVVAEHPAWLEALVDAAAGTDGEGKAVGMAGYRLCPWHEGEEIRLADGRPFLRGTTCGGGCVCIPAAAHERLGFWNEDYSPYGYEDNEYGFRANQAGLITGYVPLPHVSTLDAKGGEAEREDAYTRNKLRGVNTERARNLWFINLFLFKNGLRPLRVTPRYRVEPCPRNLGAGEEATPRFHPDPAYREILAMQKATAASPAFRAWMDAELAAQREPGGIAGKIMEKH